MTLLSTFSSYEQNRFKKYLYSPYFNEKEELSLLLELLTENLSNIKKWSLQNGWSEKQTIWKQLFDNQPFNDGQIRRLLSELTQHALHFLALQRLEKEPVKAYILLLDVLKDTNLDLHFNGLTRQANTLQQQIGLQSPMYYFHQHQIEETLHRRIERLGHKIDNLDNLKNADFYLDNYFITQKLKYYCDALEYSQFFSIKLDINLFSNFFDWIQSASYLNQPIIQAYFLVAKMLTEPQEESVYFQLKELLKQEEKTIDIAELKVLYIHIVNYCIYKKINIGAVNFFDELFRIFKSSLSLGIWLENGTINPQYYKTIVSVGIQVQEFAWTESFIQTYTLKLPPEERENALTYNLAKVYFAQQHYEKVIGQLREVEYENLTYALGGKLMLLKTYYELNEYLALDSLIDSFRVYLRRNQTISKEVRQQYLNVLRFIKKLSNVHPGDQAAAAKIENQIQECKNLADKGWIVQKVAELRGNG